MEYIKPTYNRILLLLFTTGLSLWGCTKMDSTYKEFIKEGKLVYASKPDSLLFYTGRNRASFRWKFLADPKIEKVKVFWNNRIDSAIVAIDEPGTSKSYTLDLNDLEERSYVFEFLAYDGDGNSSIKTEIVGNIYGTNYEKSLLGRVLTDALFNNDTVKLGWGINADSSAISSEIKYTNTDGTLQTVYAPKDSINTHLYKFPSGETFTYRTLYVPRLMSVDTFYSAWAERKVIGPRIDISKIGWTVEVSSFDARAGASYRPGSNAIDGKPETAWVSQVNPAGFEYPHTLTVDMLSLHKIEGFSLIQRTPLDGALKLIELFISKDKVSWESMGEYTLENIDKIQYIDLIEAKECRYFRLVGKNDYKNSKYISLAEIGVFKR